MTDFKLTSLYPTADDYNNRLINALKELPSHPAPYVVHCMEGKDRQDMSAHSLRDYAEQRMRKSWPTI